METPLFMQCVMRSRTGTSALYALPVRFQAGKIFLSTNRKSHFLSLIISQKCVMSKYFFLRLGTPEGSFSTVLVRFNANISFAFQAIQKLSAHFTNLCFAVIFGGF